MDLQELVMLEVRVRETSMVKSGFMGANNAGKTGVFNTYFEGWF